MNQCVERFEELVPHFVGSPQEADQAEGLLENLSLDESADPVPLYHFKLRDFTSSEEYVREVRDRSLRGESVFACHQRHEGLFYAKVSFESEALYKDKFLNGLVKVGSLKLSDVEDDAVLTSFEDLKRVSEGHFIVFFECRNDEEKFECSIPLNASPLARQFLTLCTGEEGPTYRGSPIQLNNNIWSVTYYQLNGDSTSGRLPSTTPIPSEEFQNLSSSVVEGFPDGSYEMKLDRNYFNYASKNVINDGPFYQFFSSAAPPTVTDMTILECGFALEC